MLILDFSSFPILKSNQIVMRQLTMDDVNEIFFLRSDDNILRFIGKEPAKDIKEAVDFINRINDEIKANEVILWGIALLEDPSTIIGTICYWNIDKQNYRAELGYVLHPQYWRKGIMKQAIEIILNYGFNQMKLHSIEARIKAGNIPSASILEASGFVEEGCLKENYFFNEKFYDTVIYSKLQ